MKSKKEKELIALRIKQKRGRVSAERKKKWLRRKHFIRIGLLMGKDRYFKPQVIVKKDKILWLNKLYLYLKNLLRSFRS